MMTQDAGPRSPHNPTEAGCSKPELPQPAADLREAHFSPRALPSENTPELEFPLLKAQNLLVEDLNQTGARLELLTEHRRFPIEMRQIYEALLADESRYYGESGDFTIQGFIHDVVATAFTWPIRKLTRLAKKSSASSYRAFVSDDNTLSYALYMRASIFDTGEQLCNRPWDLRPALRGEPEAQLNLFRVALSISTSWEAAGLYEQLAEVCDYFARVQKEPGARRESHFAGGTVEATPELIAALRESKFPYAELAKESLRQAVATEVRNLDRERSRQPHASLHEANIRALRRKLEAWQQ